ncbi:MAG: tyrosine recombinase XerC [Anaerocolumna sp.]
MAKNQKIKLDDRGRKLPEGITQRKNGLYQIRITLNGNQWVKYSKELGEAKKILLEKQAEIAEGSITNLRGISLNEYYSQWIKIHKQDRLRLRTYQNYIGYYNKNIRNTKLGRMKLEEIKSTHLVNQYKTIVNREEKPLAHDTVKYINSMISGCFNQAIEDGLIKRNPAIGAMKSVGGRAPKQKFALTEKQEMAFLEFISEGRYAMYKNMFTVLFFTGARINEILSLTDDDIFMEEERISIDKSVNYGKLEKDKKEFYITPPKNNPSIREIPMMNVVKKALLEQIEYKKLFGINNSYELPRYDDRKKFIGMCSGFIFTTSKGTIATNESLNRTIRAIVNAYNKEESRKAQEEDRNEELLPHWKMHQTRHTFATLSYKKKMRGSSISAILGHKNETVTRQIYTHIDFEIKKSDMEEAWGE